MDDWLNYALDTFDVFNFSSELVTSGDVTFDLIDRKGRE
jgi:hypothetical protein